MKIEWVKGKNWKDDRKFLITTEHKEPITIGKLCLLINQLAINELGYVKERGWMGKDWFTFFFRDAVETAVTHAENGIDWGEPKNREHIKEFCERLRISYEEVDEMLRKSIQRDLHEFGNK